MPLKASIYVFQFRKYKGSLKKNKKNQYVTLLTFLFLTIIVFKIITKNKINDKISQSKAEAYIII